MDGWDLLLLFGGSLAASLIAAVVGFGGAAVLLPILAAVFGVREAVPILTVAQLIGNASRVWFNRTEIVLPVVGWFALGSVPAALIGGFVFASAPLPVLTPLLGAFLLAVVAHRHVRKRTPPRMRLRWFAPLGLFSSFISALVGTSGPIAAPFFLAYGLVEGAYIGTEALATVVMHATKLIAYGGVAALSVRSVTVGLLLGPVLVLGSWLGKRIVDRVPQRVFVVLIEATLVIAGLRFLMGK